MGHDNSGRFLATERRKDAGVGACCGPRSNPGNMLLHPLREERAHRTHGRKTWGGTGRRIEGPGRTFLS